MLMNYLLHLRGTQQQHLGFAQGVGLSSQGWDRPLGLQQKAGTPACSHMTGADWLQAQNPLQGLCRPQVHCQAGAVLGKRPALGSDLVHHRMPCQALWLEEQNPYRHECWGLHSVAALTAVGFAAAAAAAAVGAGPETGTYAPGWRAQH